jgi:hypothetical protein
MVTLKVINCKMVDAWEERDVSLTVRYYIDVQQLLLEDY